VTAFVALCAVLAAAALATLLWPLLRRRPGEEGGRAGVAAAVVASLLPLAAFLIYFAATSWDWHAAPAPPGTQAPDLAAIKAMIEARLTEHPEDVEGWKHLGRTAIVTGDFALARRAFGEANTRTQGRDPEALVGYAESLLFLDEREIDGQAGALFERALEFAPDNPRALWYGGIVAYRRGDLPLAQRRWVELQDHELPADLRQVLAERLAELELSQGKPAADTDASGAASGIDVSVALSPSVAAKVAPGSTLFVIARRGSGGPPLAVQRRRVGNWPVSLRLSDADAMLPGTRLAAGGPLTLVARVSASGEPIASSGDLFGEVGYDFASAHSASITIDRIVP
jgi:cytochrome c-type biogenesis protein CcmH